MIKASELVPGRIYRPTRRLNGMPASYYMVIEPKKLKSMVKRIRRKPFAARKPDDARVIYGAERGHVVLNAYRRYTTDDGRREDRSRFSVEPDKRIGLREVKAKPGYTAKEATT